MKTWTLRFRALDKKIFNEIRDGSKPVETRAGTVKYQPIEVGDTLLFVCGSERFSKKISKKAHFKSVDALVAKIPFKQIMPSVSSIAEMKKVYASFPGYEEKIRECGILAFWLQ